MKRIIRYLDKHPRLFILLNALFWGGLLYLLFSDPARLIIGGAILAFLIGGYLIYGGLSSKLIRSSEIVDLTRWLSLGLGALTVIIGTGTLLGFLQGNITPEPTQISVRELRTLVSELTILELLTIIFGLILPLLFSSWLLERWRKKELHLQQTAQAEGEVFALPPFFRQYLLGPMLLIIAVSILFFIASWDKGSGVNLRQSLALMLALAPLVVVPLLALSPLVVARKVPLYLAMLPNSGIVVLTAEGVVLRRLWREKFLPYADIIAIQERALGLPERMILRGRDKKLRLPRTMKNLPRFYLLLHERVSTLRSVQEKSMEGELRSNHPALDKGCHDYRLYALCDILLGRRSRGFLVILVCCPKVSYSRLSGNTSKALLSSLLF